MRDTDSSPSSTRELALSVLTLPDIMRMEDEGLDPRGYVRREYDVDPKDYTDASALRSAIDRGSKE